MRSPRTATKSSSCESQLEKVPAKATKTKSNQKKFLKIKKKIFFFFFTLIVAWWVGHWFYQVMKHIMEL